MSSKWKVLESRVHISGTPHAHHLNPQESKFNFKGKSSGQQMGCLGIKWKIF